MVCKCFEKTRYTENIPWLISLFQEILDKDEEVILEVWNKAESGGAGYYWESRRITD